MNIPSLRALAEAPELIEVAVACVALEALEAVLVLERCVAAAAKPPALPATHRRAERLIEGARALRRELRTYRTSTLRRVSRPTNTRDRDF